MPYKVSDLPKRVYQAISEHPGLTAYKLAQMFDMNYRVIDNCLARMEHTEYEICEGEAGKLYPCGLRKHFAFPD
jgi:hypothetical protein